MQGHLHGIRKEMPELALALRYDLPEFESSHPDPFESWNLPLSPTQNPEAPEGK
jgi:hypothetical protein